jgi:tetratricopeptide (TPR) repeat protein
MVNRKEDNKKAIILIDKVICEILSKNLGKAKNLFLDLLKLEPILDRELILSINDLGESFNRKEDIAFSFIQQIDSQLTKNKNEFLYIIRQEILYNYSNDIKELLNFNNEAIKYYPNNPELLNMRGLLFSNKEEPDRAITFFDKALSFDKDNPIYLCNKARAFLDLDKRDKALELIDYALSIDRNNKFVLETKSFIEYTEVLDEERKELENKQMRIDYSIETLKNDVKNSKFEFIALAGLFVAIMAIVMKIITFDYQNFQGKSISNIIIYQFAINLPWLFAVLLILIVVALIFFRRR